MNSARAVHGIAAAILAPSTLALRATTFAEGPVRTRALGSYTAAAGVGAGVGLVLGGLVTHMLSSRVGFLLNVPLGLAVTLCAPRILPETPGRAGRLDAPGALASTLGLGAVVYGIIRSASSGWATPVTAASLTAGILVIGLFVITETRASEPILPLRLFASRQRSAANAARVPFMGAMAGFSFFTTQFLHGVLGYSPFQAGIAFLPATVVNFAGAAWLSQLSAHATYPTGVALPMVLIGLGQGFTLAPITAAGIAGARRGDANTASGLVNVAHQLDTSLGVAIFVAIAAGSGARPRTARDVLAEHVAASFAAGAVILAVAPGAHRPAHQSRSR